MDRCHAGLFYELFKEKTSMTLEELKKLLEAGEITKEEYDAKVAKLLNDNGGDDGGGDDEKTYPEAVVKKLREENAKRRQSEKNLKAKVEELQAKFAQIDLDEIEQLLEQREQAKEEQMKKQGDFEALLAKNNEAHAKELDRVLKEKDDLTLNMAQIEGELNKTVLGYETAMVAATAKCINPELLSMMIEREAKMEILENGQRVVRFLDENGEERLCPKSGKPFTLAQRIDEMKQDPTTAILFEGASAGAGSRSMNGGKVANNPWKEETMNITEQGRIMKENPDLAKRLASEAGKTLRFSN